MRIVTRPDFDGVVCAVLLKEVLAITEPIKWVEPSEIQHNLIEIFNYDVLANLPYHKNCALWFDHHYTNKISQKFSGSFEIKPSAARVVFNFYKNLFKKNYEELIFWTDKIDSADLNLDEVLHPENYNFLKLAITVDKEDEIYLNKLVELIGTQDILNILDNQEIKMRFEKTIQEYKKYENILKNHTKLIKHVSITDFRNIKQDEQISGNRFLVYSLYPESIVNVKIGFDKKNKGKVAISVGHSIFNKQCLVNSGAMLSQFGGGGHRGAGASRIDADKADLYLKEIINILLENKSNE